MRVRYDAEAVACLARIGRYYAARSPGAARNVRSDIRATIKRIALNPLIYALIGRADIRRAVTRRYAYLVYFRLVDESFVDILSIRHGAEQPRFPAEED